MFLKRFFGKCWYLIKQNKFWILSSIICSALLIFYLCYFVQKYGERHNFYYEGLSPEKGCALPYFLLTGPFVIPYLIFVIKAFKNLNFLRVFIYLILIITSFIALFFLITILGSGIGWLFICSLPLLMIILVIYEIIALVLDIKSYRAISPEDYSNKD